MNPAADELLRLWKGEQKDSFSPLDGVIARSLRAELVDRAEAAGGAVELDLGGWGWSIGVVTEAHLNEREAAAAEAFRTRMAAARARRWRRRG